MSWIYTPYDESQLGDLIFKPALLGNAGGYEPTPLNIDQQGDVYLYQTSDDGDVDIENGLVTLTTGIETAVYLSLFGGADYWANLDETEPDKQYTSQTGAIIDGAPLTSGNLRAFEDAVYEDLAWLNSVENVTADVEGPNRVHVTIELITGESLSIYTNWGNE